MRSGSLVALKDAKEWVDVVLQTQPRKYISTNRLCVSCWASRSSIHMFFVFLEPRRLRSDNFLTSNPCTIASNSVNESAFAAKKLAVVRNQKTMENTWKRHFKTRHQHGFIVFSCWTEETSCYGKNSTSTQSQAKPSLRPTTTFHFHWPREKTQPQMKWEELIYDIYIYMYVCMYVCMHVCMYVCMCVCM